MDWTIVTGMRLCLTGVIKHLFYDFLFVNHINIIINNFQSSFWAFYTPVSGEFIETLFNFMIFYYNFFFSKFLVELEVGPIT